MRFLFTENEAYGLFVLFLDMNEFIKMKGIALLMLTTLTTIFSYSQVADTTKISDSATVPNRNYSMTYSSGGKAFGMYEVKDGKNVTYKEEVGFTNSEITEKIIDL